MFWYYSLAARVSVTITLITTTRAITPARHIRGGDRKVILVLVVVHVFQVIVLQRVQNFLFLLPPVSRREVVRDLIAKSLLQRDVTADDSPGDFIPATVPGLEFYLSGQGTGGVGAACREHGLREEARR